MPLVGTPIGWSKHLHVFHDTPNSWPLMPFGDTLHTHTTVFATFPCSHRQNKVTAITVYDVAYGVSTGGHMVNNETTGVELKLSNIMLTAQLGGNLTAVNAADVPLIGWLSVSIHDIMVLPYVGVLELINPLDAGNAAIQEVSGGFLVKGSVEQRIWQDAPSLVAEPVLLESATPASY
jgi:hypothetical protein